MIVKYRKDTKVTKKHRLVLERSVQVDNNDARTVIFNNRTCFGELELSRLYVFIVALYLWITMLDLLLPLKLPGFVFEVLLPRSFIALMPRSKHRNLGRNTRKQPRTNAIAKATRL